MSVLEKLNLGIVGACKRGGSYARAVGHVGKARVHAVCDVDAVHLPEAAVRMGAEEAYTDYCEMLARSEVDAVILGTPMYLHASQAVAALRQGVHVLSEVTAGVSLEECRQLVAACRASSATYMMAENYVYSRQNVLVRELVRRGWFGDTYYAEGEYLHELKPLNEATPWRRVWQTGVDGITYGTHSLGPILQWMPGDRVTSVCCAGSGHHYRDVRGVAYENQDSCVMLCAMRSGGLVKVRVDMLSDRPHAMTNYQLQGSDGCYESARAPGERDRVWLRAHAPDAQSWADLSAFDDLLPEEYRALCGPAEESGHGGGDFFVLHAFVNALVRGSPPPIGIHEAMDMTLPGLVSQQSIREGACWLAVPDSRDW